MEKDEFGKGGIGSRSSWQVAMARATRVEGGGAKDGG